jgi:hypothetical protein
MNSNWKLKQEKPTMKTFGLLELRKYLGTRDWLLFMACVTTFSVFALTVFVVAIVLLSGIS